MTYRQDRAGFQTVTGGARRALDEVPIVLRLNFAGSEIVGGSRAGTQAVDAPTMNHIVAEVKVPHVLQLGIALANS
jgi:hypothetical protein